MKKNRLRLSVVCLCLSLLLVLLLPGCGRLKLSDGETLRFVFLADSRGDALDDPIHTSVLNAIIAQIKALSPQPAFVIFAGDMAYRGYIYDTHQDIKIGYTFQMWKDLFKELTDAGIALYTTIGNHELYRHDDKLPSDDGFFLENQQQYQTVFSENPDNGPPGYEELVYSFASPGGEAFFAVLDPYYLTADEPSTNLGGNIDNTQFAWLTAQVAQTKALHKFLFIHTPYYYVNEDPDEPSSANATLTNLWAFLDNNLFDLYACGHSHLFSRKTIDRSIIPNPQLNPPVLWKNNVVQLLNGAAGAGPSTGEPTVNRNLWHVFNAPNTYYFSVVDIKNGQVTVNSYSGNTGSYSVFDEFTVKNDSSR